MKSLVKLVVLGAVLVLAAPASALTISDVVGGDELVFWGNPDSSNPGSDNDPDKLTEGEWVASYFGIDPGALQYTQLTNSGSDAWTVVDGFANLWAFDFGSLQPEYFVIKTGSGVTVDGSGTTYTAFLYDNLVSFQYAVIDLDRFGRAQGQVEIGMVSHVGTTGSTAVPEPSTLLLLGAGMVGLFIRGRRRK